MLEDPVEISFMSPKSISLVSAIFVLLDVCSTFADERSLKIILGSKLCKWPSALAI